MTVRIQADILSKKLQAPELINIILIDDNIDNLNSIERMLKHSQRNILKAVSINNAIQYASERNIALIIIDGDIEMSSKAEMSKLLGENAKTKEVAIIFIVPEQTIDTFELQEQESGIIDYISKPLKINELVGKVRVFEKLYLQKLDLKIYAEKVEGINKQLDEFVYIVSHDLKAPLRGLSSLATFLDDELGAHPKKEVLEILNMMKSRTMRMQNLIDGILHYSRMANSKTEKENIHVRELINNIIDLICPPENIRIEFPDNLPTINTERIKLHEVFQNLISNAIKHNNKEFGEVRISFIEMGDYYEFSVHDNGTGIKPEHQEKIFSIFQTLQPKDKFESTGIGLTIVKKIIEQQDGKITVNSEIGKGSTFKFLWKK